MRPDIKKLMEMAIQRMKDEDQKYRKKIEEFEKTVCEESDIELLFRHLRTLSDEILKRGWYIEGDGSNAWPSGSHIIKQKIKRIPGRR